MHINVSETGFNQFSEKGSSDPRFSVGPSFLWGVLIIPPPPSSNRERAPFSIIAGGLNILHPALGLTVHISWDNKRKCAIVFYSTENDFRQKKLWIFNKYLKLLYSQ